MHKHFDLNDFHGRPCHPSNFHHWNFHWLKYGLCQLESQYTWTGIACMWTAMLTLDNKFWPYQLQPLIATSLRLIILCYSLCTTIMVDCDVFWNSFNASNVYFLIEVMCDGLWHVTCATTHGKEHSQKFWWVTCFWKIELKGIGLWYMKFTYLKIYAVSIPTIYNMKQVDLKASSADIIPLV